MLHSFKRAVVFFKLPLFFLVFFISCNYKQKLLEEEKINPYEEIEVAIEENNLEKASKMIEDKLKENEKDPNALFLKGTIKLKEKNYNDAEKLLEESLNIDPKNPAGQFNLASLYLELKNYHKCLNTFQRFIRENKKSQFYNDALIGVNFCFEKIIEEENTDLSGILPVEKRGSILLYRKLGKKDAFDGKIKFYLAREVYVFTSQVSIIFKNKTGDKIHYNFKNISLEKNGKIIEYEPSMYRTGADYIPMEGELDNGKYAYLIIGCPEIDLTKPIIIKFKDFLGQDFQIKF